MSRRLCPSALFPKFNITQDMSQNTDNNAAPQVKINQCIYPDLKITLSIIPALLLETDRKCYFLKGHFMLDIKIGLLLAFRHKCRTRSGSRGKVLRCKPTPSTPPPPPLLPETTCGFLIQLVFWKKKTSPVS